MKVKCKKILLGCNLLRLSLLVIIPGIALFGILRLELIPKGLTASYYDNSEWKGVPAHVRQEQEITLKNYEQFNKDSHLPSTDFSISWRGWLFIDEDSDYRLMTRSDDGSSVMLNGRLIVDNGGFHGIQEVKEEVFLNKGFHQIVISYFNGPGTASFFFQIAKDRIHASDEVYSLNNRCFSHLTFFDEWLLPCLLQSPGLYYAIVGISLTIGSLTIGIIRQRLIIILEKIDQRLLWISLHLPINQRLLWINLHFSTILNKTNPFALGLLVALGSIITYLVCIGHPVWIQVDDPIMAMLIAGVVYTPQPSVGLFGFMHYLYIWFINRLYIWQPDIPWYAIVFMFIITGSLIALNYAIVRLRRHPYFFLIAIFATIGTIFPALWHLQFTVVAGISSLAGSMLLLSFFICKPATKASSIIGVVTSLFLLSMGWMIRYVSLLMVGIIVLPYLVLLTLTFLRTTPWGKATKIHILKFFIIGIIAVVAIIGLNVLEQVSYRNSPEWRKWHILNINFSEFGNYQRITYSKQTRPLFEAVGWNLTDYRMFMSWQYVDPVRYAPEKFVSIANASLKGRMIKKMMLFLDFENLKSAIPDIQREMKHISRMIPSVLLCIVVVGLTAIHWRKENLFSVGAIGGVFIAVLLYLYAGFHRTPFRVLLPLWLSLLWMLLLVAAYSHHRRTRHARRWKGYLMAAQVILPCLLFLSLVNDVRKTHRYVTTRVAAQQRLKHAMAAWQTHLPQGAIIYSIADAFPYEDHLPLQSFAYLRSIKGFIGTGWINQTPLQREYLTALGLGGDFYAELAQKEHVYFVIVKGRYSWEGGLTKSGLNALRDYYQEQYGLELSLVEEPNLPYLARMVFKKRDEGRQD